MGETSKATANDPDQVVESIEPSLKKQQRLSTELLTLEEEFKAFRAEYDERRLNEMVEEKLLTEAQRNVLRRPVPKDMTRSDVFLGSKHRELATLVNDVGFHVNEQCRRIVGVVQPFGAGKTKTALMLSDAFVVLPIRWTTGQILMKKLMKAQDTLFETINIDTATTGVVQAFSARCLRLMELMLLSVAAIFDKCVSQANDLVTRTGSSEAKWFDASKEQHRLQFAILAISSGSVVVSEIAKWFEANIEATTTENRFDDLRTQVLNDARTKSGLRLVFVMDEVQRLFGEKNGGLCQGYVLHDDLASKVLENWKTEAVNKEPVNKGGRCTDLFYQLAAVMAKWLGVECAFVTCSTMFETSPRIEKMSSPKLKTERFIETHWLSAADCKDLIQHYFVATDEQLEPFKLSQFARPRFACDFIVRLFRNLNTLSESVGEWLRTSYDAVVDDCIVELNRAITPHLQNPKLVPSGATTWTGSNDLLNTLLMAIRMNAGILPNAIVKFSDPLESFKSYTQLITTGLLRLQPIPGPAACVAIADPLATTAILKCYGADELTTLRDTYARDIELNGIHTRHDKSHKGYAFEPVLALLAMHGLLDVPWYATDGTVMYGKLQSTGKFAMTSDEFKVLKIWPSGIAKEGDFISELLGAQNLSEELDFVYLPSEQSGPDILFRGKEIVNRDDEEICLEVNVAVQSKVESKGAYSFQDFLGALSSLKPTRMLHAVTEPPSGQQRLESVLQRAAYIRVIFAALGFSNATQHVVHEYNIRQASSDLPSFIYLLNLDDLRDSLKSVYDMIKLQKEMKLKQVQPNLVVKNEMICYESAWKNVPENEKKAMSRDTLVELCQLWGVVGYSKKDKEDLKTALNEHEQTLTTRLQQLALNLPAAAASSSTSYLQSV